MPQFPKPKLPMRKKGDENGKPLPSDTSQNASQGGDDLERPANQIAAEEPLGDAVAVVDDERQVFYINVTVHDASAVIRKKVSQKISEKQAPLPGPQKFKDKVAKSVANRAAANVPPSAVAAKMAAKMPKMLPMKMKQKGLTVAVEEVFREGPYFVLQVQVRHVDMAKVLEESQKGKDEEEDDDDDESVSSEDINAFYEKQKEEMANLDETENCTTTPAYHTSLSSLADWFLSLLGVRVRSHIEGEYLPSVIQKKMSTTMGSMLKKKYASKDIKAEAKTLQEEKQARYFFANLKKVRAESK